ncbi:NUDIX domain-containing protein [Nanoarchaeota archaeon]
MIRRGVVAVVFRKDKGKNKYLLLRRKLHWKGWELLKGGCKAGERKNTSLLREVKEEIGVKELIFEETKYINKFKYQKEYVKDHRKYSGVRNSAYVVEIFTKKIKFDNKEHSGFKWAGKKETLKLLTWDDQKEIFRKIVK